MNFSDPAEKGALYPTVAFPERVRFVHVRKNDWESTRQPVPAGVRSGSEDTYLLGAATLGAGLQVWVLAGGAHGQVDSGEGVTGGRCDAVAGEEFSSCGVRMDVPGT